MDNSTSKGYHNIPRCGMKLRNMVGFPQNDCATIVGSSLTYCRLRSLFRLPVVYAVSPSATTVMEKRMDELGTRSVAMVTESDIKSYISTETGIDRLKKMYYKNEIGQPSTEITYIKQSLLNACGFGFLFSSVFSSLQMKRQFVEDHRATAFKSRYRAERLMNDKIILAVLKDGTKWALRIGSFLLPFLLVSQSIAVYRNKSSPLEYAAGSAVSGFLIKLNLGLKGSLAGGLIGAVMGLATGAVIYGLLYAGDELQEQRHYRETLAFLERQREMEELRGPIPSPSSERIVE